jgi:hypothetical protein
MTGTRMNPLARMVLGVLVGDVIFAHRRSCFSILPESTRTRL